MEKIRYLHRPPEPDPKVMSFVEHLEELRRRLMIMLACVVVGAIVGWFLEPWLLRTLEHPLTEALKHTKHPITTHLVVTKIYGAFTLRLKLAALTGIVLSIPVLLQQTWGFVMPALGGRFYRMGPYVIVAGVVLFAIGGVTGYLVMPLAINFFIGQGNGLVSFIPDAGAFVSFVSLIIVVFGISFELPLILVLLCVAGITSSRWLWGKRVVAFFVIFAVATVITPGADWISPLILGAILYVLYLGGLVVARLLGH